MHSLRIFIFGCIIIVTASAVFTALLQIAHKYHENYLKIKYYIIGTFLNLSDLKKNRGFFSHLYNMGRVDKPPPKCIKRHLLKFSENCTAIYKIIYKILDDMVVHTLQNCEILL